jgi:hypothetical protein
VLASGRSEILNADLRLRTEIAIVRWPWTWGSLGLQRVIEQLLAPASQIHIARFSCQGACRNFALGLNRRSHCALSGKRDHRGRKDEGQLDIVTVARATRQAAAWETRQGARSIRGAVGKVIGAIKKLACSIVTLMDFSKAMGIWCASDRGSNGLPYWVYDVGRSRAYSQGLKAEPCAVVVLGACSIDGGSVSLSMKIMSSPSPNHPSAFCSTPVTSTKWPFPVASRKTLSSPFRFLSPELVDFCRCFLTILSVKRPRPWGVYDRGSRPRNRNYRCESWLHW